jgi:hypothetical protein
MTRAQFLNATSFRVKGATWKGAETYRKSDDCIVSEVRSSVDNRMLFFDHHCNITSVGSTGFKGYTFVFNKKVNVSFKFDDLVEFIEEA